jgi:hypothetical protein
MEVCTVERDQQALPREAYAAAERRSARSSRRSIGHRGDQGASSGVALKQEYTVE